MNVIEIEWVRDLVVLGAALLLLFLIDMMWSLLRKKRRGEVATATIRWGDAECTRRMAEYEAIHPERRLDDGHIRGARAHGIIIDDPLTMERRNDGATITFNPENWTRIPFDGLRPAARRGEELIDPPRRLGWVYPFNELPPPGPMMEAVANESPWVAGQRARHLLVEHLTRDELVQLYAYGYVEVTTASGTIYRLYNEDSFKKVRRVSRDGREDMVYCVVSKEGVPHADLMLAWKLLLETDEPGFLRTAVATQLVV